MAVVIIAMTTTPHITADHCRACKRQPWDRRRLLGGGGSGSLCGGLVLLILYAQHTAASKYHTLTPHQPKSDIDIGAPHLPAQ